MAFLNRVVSNPQLFAFGLELLAKQAVGYLHKILIRAFPQVDIPLDVSKVSYNKGSNPLAQAMVCDVFDGPVEVIVDAIPAPTVQIQHPSGCGLDALQVLNALKASMFFVVPLVYAFDVSSVNHEGRPIGRVKAGCKVIEAHVNRQMLDRVETRRFTNGFFVNELNIKLPTVGDRDDSYLLQVFYLNVFRQFECQTLHLRLVLFTESVREPNVNPAILDAGRPALNGNNPIGVIFLVLGKVDLVRVFARLFHHQQGKERLHVAFHQPQNLLAGIRQQQLVILIVFALVIILRVVQVLVIQKEILPHRVQPDIVEPGRMPGHGFHQPQFLITEAKPVFLGQENFFHIFNIPFLKPKVKEGGKGNACGASRHALSLPGVNAEVSRAD